MDDFWDGDQDFEVIENPNNLGRYQSCDQFIRDLSYAINGGCHYSRMFINDGVPLDSMTLDLGILNRANLQTFLENQTQETTSMIFKEAVNNGKIIESTQKYLLVIDPSKDTIEHPDVEDGYIPIPNEPFLAFAKPSVHVERGGQASMRWMIDDIKDIDLSGRGADLMKYLQSQVPSPKLKPHALAAE